jgi:peroxiredoxin
MGLIGLGLLILGVAAFVLLPKPGLSKDTASLASAIPAKVSFPAPELALTDLQGNPVSLANTRGQVVLVNNWATWCPPCKDEMPALEAYYKKHHDQNFNLIAIEAGEPAAEVASFVRQYKLTFPVWLDPGSKATTAFRNDALPSSYVIDPQGTVRLAWSGAIDRDNLETYVTPMLEATNWTQK